MGYVLESGVGNALEESVGENKMNATRGVAGVIDGREEGMIVVRKVSVNRVVARKVVGAWMANESCTLETVKMVMLLLNGT